MRKQISGAKKNPVRWALMAASALSALNPVLSVSSALAADAGGGPQQFYAAPGLISRADRSNANLTQGGLIAGFMSFLSSASFQTSGSVNSFSSLCGSGQGCNPASGTVIDPYYNPQAPTPSTSMNGPGDYPELCRIVDNNSAGTSSANFMLPYSSVGEWVAFLLNGPSSVNRYPCCRQVPINQLVEVILYPNMGDPTQKAIHDNFVSSFKDGNGNVDQVKLNQAMAGLQQIYNAYLTNPSSVSQWFPYARLGDSFVYFIQTPDPSIAGAVDEFTLTATCLPNPVLRTDYVNALSDPSGLVKAQVQQQYNRSATQTDIANFLGAQSATQMIALNTNELNAYSSASSAGFVGGLVSTQSVQTAATGTNSFAGNTFIVTPNNVYIGAMANGTAVVTVPAPTSGATGPTAGTVLAVGRDGSVIQLGPATASAGFGADRITNNAGGALWLNNGAVAQGLQQALNANNGGNPVTEAGLSGTVTQIFNANGALSNVGGQLFNTSGFNASSYGVNGVNVGSGIGSGSGVLNGSAVATAPGTNGNGQPVTVMSSASNANFAALVAQATANGSSMPTAVVSTTTLNTDGNSVSPLIGVDTGGTTAQDSALTAVIVNAGGSVSLVVGGAGSGVNGQPGQTVGLTGGGTNGGNGDPTPTVIPVSIGGLTASGGSGPRLGSFTNVNAGPNGNSGVISQLNAQNLQNGAGVTYSVSQVVNLGCVSGCQVVGQCGSANGVPASSAPSGDYCTAGTFSGLSGSGPWSWSCNGQNGGANASCSAPVIVAGACGPANGGSYTNAPTGGYCNSGDFSGLSGSGPWTWACNGQNGGGNASCSANQSPAVIAGACGSANGGTYASAPPDGYCSAGTFSGLAGSGPWTWSCYGQNGGTDAACSANVEIVSCCTSGDGGDSGDSGDSGDGGDSGN